MSETIAPLKDAVAELAARTRDARLLAEELLPYDTDEQLDAWLVRFLGGGDADAIDEAEAKVVASVEWRAGPGRAIATAARDAVAAATENGGWDNAPVLAAAPHASTVAPFLADGRVVTLRNQKSDGLVYAIRAGTIDDKALMAGVNADDLAEFFLYAKAVNERVAARMTAKTGELATIVTVNDLAGVDIFGDASFRNALSAASKQGDAVFPGLGGPTVLLNLPRLLGALVKLFTPLFPPAVRAKLKFDAFDLGPPDALVTADGKAKLQAYLVEAL